MKKLLLMCGLALLAPMALAQAGASGPKLTCPERNLMYWQAFSPGGESDLAARHQQMLLKKKCPATDIIVQYKAGAGGGLMWSQMNQLPGDGLNVVGINLPHIVFQPLEGQVQYKTQDITPVFWFHYTPDILVVAEQSPIKTFADFLRAAKAEPGKVSLGGSGLNSANHAAHERLDAAFGIKTNYIPYKGTGDMATAVLGSQVDGAITYSPLPSTTGAGYVRWRLRWRSAIRCCPTCPRSGNSASTGLTGPTVASEYPSPHRPPQPGACPTCGRSSTTNRR